MKTTVSDKTAPCQPDKVNREFTAHRPNQLWVSDFAYVPNWARMFSAASIIDVFARRIVGWRASETASDQLVLDVLEQACVDVPGLASVVFDVSAGSSIGRVSGL